MLAEKALVALTALKRVESDRNLPVHDTTRDLVRRALENAGILFVESDRGRGVKLLNEPPSRLRDADADGAEWREVAKIVLHIDPVREPDRARRAWESHLARARWMTEKGYRHLLEGGAPH